jgi:hypothetical protein
MSPPIHSAQDQQGDHQNSEVTPQYKKGYNTSSANSHRPSSKDKYSQYAAW